MRLFSRINLFLILSPYPIIMSNLYVLRLLKRSLQLFFIKIIIDWNFFEKILDIYLFNMIIRLTVIFYYWLLILIYMQIWKEVLQVICLS